eukprot:TRINITY_DN38222_c0_g1_i1.p1 TRINITY_DN38222_c0_g1~~TRINITY_DN38222_c0_g1_i1.p1  ORF type:complete len:223 (+),score=-10.33 TRINITY_DN38222_c0_g1_i1:387-1055(+)
MNTQNQHIKQTSNIFLYYLNKNQKLIITYDILIYQHLFKRNLYSQNFIFQEQKQILKTLSLVALSLKFCYYQLHALQNIPIKYLLKFHVKQLYYSVLPLIRNHKQETLAQIRKFSNQKCTRQKETWAKIFFFFFFFFLYNVRGSELHCRIDTLKFGTLQKITSLPKFGCKGRNIQIFDRNVILKVNLFIYLSAHSKTQFPKNTLLKKHQQNVINFFCMTKNN